MVSKANTTDSKGSEIEYEVERFDLKTRHKIEKALSKILNDDPHTPINEMDALDMERCLTVCPAHVCMVEAKSQKAKRLLVRFMDKDQTLNAPTLDYTGSDVSRSLFSMDYVFKIMDVFRAMGEDHIVFFVGNDMPGTFENEDFSFLLAPRIEDNDSDDDDKEF